MRRKKHRMAGLFMLVLGLTLLTACGGGGDPASGTGGSISGMVTKGPVHGATVKAYGVNADGTREALIGTGQTDPEGRFGIMMKEYSGPVYMEVTGGRYTDEATGVEMPLLGGSPLAGAIPYMEAGAIINGVQVTPLTAMAGRMAVDMPGGLTERNIIEANDAVGGYFMAGDILFTHPMDPLIVNSGDSVSASRRNYGMNLAAMSQYSFAQGADNSAATCYALVEDASDGYMDGSMWNSRLKMGPGGMTGGMMGGGTMMPVDAGYAGLADAMREFIESPQNRSGITADDMLGLMEHLRYSNGHITNTAD